MNVVSTKVQKKKTVSWERTNSPNRDKHFATYLHIADLFTDWNVLILLSDYASDEYNQIIVG